jgi:HEAT repeat protein
LFPLSIAVLGGCAPQQPSAAKEFRAPDEAPASPPPVAQTLDPALQPKALREMLTAADSDDIHLRANAVEALQEVNSPEAPRIAMRALSDPNDTVRFAACLAIGQLRDTDAHDRLLTMYTGNELPTVKVGVLFALHRMGDMRYSHDFEKMARDLDAEVRGKTALALGFLGEPSATKILRPMRFDVEQAVRLQASISLWQLGDPLGLDDVAAAAVSRYPDDLILATLGLASTHNPRIIQHVRANLVNDFPEVELAAARAMGELGSDEGYTIAMKGAASTDRIERSLAALALGAIGRTDAQATLAKLLADPEPTVRLSAATAILQLPRT